MPGIGELIEGAMQQAPHPGRQPRVFMEPSTPKRFRSSNEKPSVSWQLLWSRIGWVFGAWRSSLLQCAFFFQRRRAPSS